MYKSHRKLLRVLSSPEYRSAPGFTILPWHDSWYKTTGIQKTVLPLTLFAISFSTIRCYYISHTVPFIQNIKKKQKPLQLWYIVGFGFWWLQRFQTSTVRRCFKTMKSNEIYTHVSLKVGGWAVTLFNNYHRYLLLVVKATRHIDCWNLWLRSHNQHNYTHSGKWNSKITTSATATELSCYVIIWPVQ